VARSIVGHPEADEVQTTSGGPVQQLQAVSSHGLLAAIVSSSDDAIISKSLEGTITSWNAGAERLFGYGADEVVGASIFSIIPPELHDEEVRILSLVRAGERIDHFRTQRLTKDGRRIEVSLTISPIRDANGVIVGASKSARDVSREIEAERNNAVLAAVVQSSDDAIVSKDLNSIVISWNPAAERMFGWTAEEMIGRSILTIIPPELRHEEETIVANIRAGRRMEHFETVRVAKDGRRLHVSITVSPVRDATGRIVGASKIARDVTEQREAQRRKDEFLAILAHELRNPLAPVRYAIAMLARAGISPEQRERSQAILERQTEHMARLLDDLLDVSRIAAGKVELKKATVELRPIALNALDAVRGLMQERGHELAVHLSEEPMWLDADPVRIAQILVNLLTNAAKYTDPGGRIELATAREGDEAVIRVKDNGTGFDPRMKSRLFTLFAQLEPVLDRAAGGLGIGLALVREFVDRHGGRVEAHSEGRGKGAEFVVRLPCVAAPRS
jgi:PAS domain S-box-containing protein